MKNSKSKRLLAGNSLKKGTTSNDAAEVEGQKHLKGRA
jgi:hypothetical protein